MLGHGPRQRALLAVMLGSCCVLQLIGVIKLKAYTTVQKACPGRAGKPQQHARAQPVWHRRAKKPYTSAETAHVRGAPANPSNAPAQSPRGTASPAMVLRMGVKMMDARIRNAPFAIVVSCSPYTCGQASRP